MTVDRRTPCIDCGELCGHQAKRCRSCAAMKRCESRGRRGFDPAPVLGQFPGARNAEIAEALDVAPSTVANWRAGRLRIGEWMADRIAVDLGLHISMLWPEATP